MDAFGLRAVAAELIPAAPIIASRDCLLTIVANRMNVKLDPNQTRPTVRPETTTTLLEFQDAIEPFWHFRPEQFLNVYNPLSHEIFLMTDVSYYRKTKRFVFDSLVHELTHYVQHIYQKADFTQEDDSLENQAVAVQTWFRETYGQQLREDAFLCPDPLNQ